MNEKIQADVLQRSRRRCCVCYGLNRDLEIKKGQIAHLDQDRGNNDPANLVFLCFEHHDEYDTKTSQSKGLRQKEVECYRSELDVYFHSWSRQPNSVTAFDLQQRVLLEISLIPHRWKNHYMARYPGQFREGTFSRTQDYRDVWEMLLDVMKHAYSQHSWREYLALFTDGIREVVEALERIVMMHGGDLSSAMKLTILQANSQLRVESEVYRTLPQLIEKCGVEGSDGLFLERFKSTLRVLMDLSRLADELRTSKSNAI